MKESAQAALSYVRSRADAARASRPTSSRTPTSTSTCRPGAIPKDGPSAGVTMATALASLLTGRPVQPDLAMTGEITLRGKVLPVGGIKEKVLAAQRAGIETVILPRRNEKDLEDVPAGVRDTLRFHFVDTMDEVLAHALGARPATAGPGSRAADRHRPPSRRPPHAHARAAQGSRSSAAGSSSGPSASAVPPTFARPAAAAARRPLRALRRPRARDAARGAGLPRQARPTAAWRVRVVPEQVPRAAGRGRPRAPRPRPLRPDERHRRARGGDRVPAPRRRARRACRVAAVEDVVRAWRDRIVDLKRDQRFRVDRGVQGARRRRGRRARASALAAPRHADPAAGISNDELHHARALPRLPGALPLLRHPPPGGGGAHARRRSRPSTWSRSRRSPPASRSRPGSCRAGTRPRSSTAARPSCATSRGVLRGGAAQARARARRPAVRVRPPQRAVRREREPVLPLAPGDHAAGCRRWPARIAAAGSP